MSSAAVSLATTQPRSSRPSTSGRTPCGSRAAYSVSSSMKTRLKAPLQVRQHLHRGLLDGAAGVGGQQRGDQRGVVGRLVRQGAGDQRALLGVPLGQPALQLEGVGQVAVVAEGDAAGGGGPEGRLGVLPDAGAGGGVAGVADGQVAAQRAERGLVEDLGDQTHVLEDHDLGAVADRDPGGLLAAVLQRVEAEVGELGHLLARGPDPEDATGVLGAAVVGVEVVVQATICTSSRRRAAGHSSRRRAFAASDWVALPHAIASAARIPT